MTRVAIVGASGYTGVELYRILVNHPAVQVTCATSRQNAGEPFAEVFPSLLGRTDLICDPVDTAVINEKADFIFTALPHQTAVITSYSIHYTKLYESRGESWDQAWA